MKIKNFTEIDAWKEAHILTRNIYSITNKPPCRDFGLKDQIRRAACSIMANIAEGFGCYSNSEFIRYLVISRRSCSELESHLYIALDQKYISQDEFDNLIKQSSKVAQLVNGFIRYLRTNQQANGSTNKRINGLTNKRGAVLITVIIILIFLAVLGMSVIAFLFSRTSYSQMQLDRLKALYLAEAGISKAIYELRTDIDVDGDGVGNIPSTKLGAGAYKTRHNFQTSTITSTGEVNRIKRTVQIRYSAL